MSHNAHSLLPAEGHRRRATQRSVLDKRAAKAATLKIEGRLTEWHTQIAHLRGLSTFGRSRSSSSAELSAAIEALAAEIHEHRAEFTAAVAALPAKVAGSSWIEDIDRALCRAAEVVESIQATDIALSR